MAKHDEFDDFFGDVDDLPVLDTRADGRLMRVPLARISPNLVNPRTHFGTPTELKELGDSLRRRQIQAVPVVSRAAYLKLWPDHAEQIGNVDVVIVSGERRYRAAGTVELPALEVVSNDDVAESRKTFMDAVVSENVDRQNFDPIEEAFAVDALVEAFGSGREVAQHFKRADGWVSQRRILLHLAPEVQEMVRARTIPVEPARKLAKLARDGQWTAERQFFWWEEQQKQRATAVTERKAKRRQEQQDQTTEGGTLNPAPGSAEDRAAENLTAVKSVPPPADPPDGDREQAARTDPAAGAPPRVVPDPADVRVVPWDDPRAVARIAAERMTPDGVAQLVKLLGEHTGQ